MEYFASPRCWVVDSVFSGDGKVLAPYGGFALENGDADGGWIATATDLVRFMCALDGSGPTRYSNGIAYRMRIGCHGRLTCVVQKCPVQCRRNGIFSYWTWGRLAPENNRSWAEEA